VNFAQTMGELRTTGMAQDRKVYGRHGVQRQMFGVGYAALNQLAKKIKSDHKPAAQGRPAIPPTDLN
jgi:hypothetical protein